MPMPMQVANIMVPLLRFYFHEEVRTAAMAIMPQLLRAAQAAQEKNLPGASPQYVKQLLDFTWQPFMDAIAKVSHIMLCLVQMLLNGVDQLQ